MALFPKIDNPCPLGIDEQRRINGHCSRCHKHVHVLDGMSDVDRVALLANASGSLCVSYRRGSARMASLAAIAITLVAGSAFAGEERVASTSLLPTTRQEAPTTPILPESVVAGQINGDVEKPVLDEIIMVGGITTPQDAEWIDDSDLPELPMRASGTETALTADAQPARSR